MSRNPKPLSSYFSPTHGKFQGPLARSPISQAFGGPFLWQPCQRQDLSRLKITIDIKRFNPKIDIDSIQFPLSPFSPPLNLLPPVVATRNRGEESFLCFSFSMSIFRFKLFLQQSPKKIKIRCVLPQLQEEFLIIAAESVGNKCQRYEKKG